jgi:hypothetical protein
LKRWLAPILGLTAALAGLGLWLARGVPSRPRERIDAASRASLARALAEGGRAAGAR